MSKKKDVMKPNQVSSGVMPFSDFSKQVRITSGFGNVVEKKEDVLFKGAVPPYPRSVLIEKGYIKR